MDGNVAAIGATPAIAALAVSAARQGESLVCAALHEKSKKRRLLLRIRCIKKQALDMKASNQRGN